MLTNAEVAEREHRFALWTDLAARYADRPEWALDCLTRAVMVDGGDAPCSRYGTRASSFAPVAALASLVYADATGEPITREGHEHMVSLVVNDHDDPAYLIVSYGADVLDAIGATIEDYLDPETRSAPNRTRPLGDPNMTESTYTTDHEREAYARGADAAKDAASWAADGNSDPAAIIQTLRMMADGDPAAIDRLPDHPTLSGEWADHPTPLSLAREIIGDDMPPADFIDAVSDAFEAGVGETFEQACEAELRQWLGVPDDRPFDEWRLDECGACGGLREDHPVMGHDFAEPDPPLGDFTLEITTGNEAMQTREDVARALRDAADRVGTRPDLSGGSIYDENGSKVGYWMFAD